MAEYWDSFLSYCIFLPKTETCIYSLHLLSHLLISAVNNLFKAIFASCSRSLSTLRKTLTANSVNYHYL